jgi:hypothetical protein
MVKTTLSNYRAIHKTLQYFLFPKPFYIVNKKFKRGRIAKFGA